MLVRGGRELSMEELTQPSPGDGAFELGEISGAGVHSAVEPPCKAAAPKRQPAGTRRAIRPSSRRARIAMLREAAQQLTAEFGDLARTSPSRRDIPLLADIRNTTLADLYAVDLLR